MTRTTSSNTAARRFWVAGYEYQQGARGCLLGVPDIRKAIREKYVEIYSMVLGDKAPGGGQPFALLPDSFKGCVLHRLRMEYAEAMRKYLKDEQFFRYLDDSLKAWAALRTSKPAEEFLRSLAEGTSGKRIADYVGEEDWQYFEDVYALCGRAQQEPTNYLDDYKSLISFLKSFQKMKIKCDTEKVAIRCEADMLRDEAEEMMRMATEIGCKGEEMMLLERTEMRCRGRDMLREAAEIRCKAEKKMHKADEMEREAENMYAPGEGAGSSNLSLT